MRRQGDTSAIEGHGEMTHRQTINFDAVEELKKARRSGEAAASLIVQACQIGDVAAFYQAIDRINATEDGWTTAMRAVVRMIRSVSPEIKSAK
jgi:hypothetical protein